MLSDDTPAHGAENGQQSVPSTRQLLIEVAQREISERGYNGVSLRSIARRANVDPSLVRHYFGSKQSLLTQAVRLEIDPTTLAAEVLRGSDATVGRRTVKALLTQWDNPRTAPMSLTRLSGALNSEEVAQLTRDDFIGTFFGTITAQVSPDHPELRASLAATQLIGTALTRYLVKDPVIASCEQQDLIRILGRTIQRYFTEPLPVDATGGTQAARDGAVKARHRSHPPSEDGPPPRT